MLSTFSQIYPNVGISQDRTKRIDRNRSKKRPKKKKGTPIEVAPKNVQKKGTNKSL